MTLLRESIWNSSEPAQDADPVLRALRVEAPPPRHGHGVTTAWMCDSAGQDGEWLVRLPSGQLRKARTAYSCLIRPRQGDLVQLATAGENCWVLAILERPQTADVCELELGQASVRLHAGNLQLSVDGELRLDGRQLSSQAQSIATAAQERQTHISGTDAAHSGSLLLHVDRHMGLHANSAALSSASLLKLDAGQIHIA